MKKLETDKIIIGRIEKIDFPEWGLYNLDAKVDTGAFTSSLHCHHIELADDKQSVSFFVLDPSHPEFDDRNFICPVSDIRMIRSSNGIAEERIIIMARMRLSEKDYSIELSLTDRSEMRNPVLLGRKFIRNKFIVDVSSKYLRKEV